MENGFFNSSIAAREFNFFPRGNYKCLTSDALKEIKLLYRICNFYLTKNTRERSRSGFLWVKCLRWNEIQQVSRVFPFLLVRVSWRLDSVIRVRTRRRYDGWSGFLILVRFRDVRFQACFSRLILTAGVCDHGGQWGVEVERFWCGAFDPGGGKVRCWWLETGWNCVSEIWIIRPRVYPRGT